MVEPTKESKSRRDARLAAGRKRYHDNKEERKRKQKEYYWNNRDEILSKERQYYCDPDYRQKKLASAKKWSRTRDGWFKRVYSIQIRSARKRGMQLPTYTSEELKDWAERCTNFDELYQTWAASGYSKSLKPSVDRINPLKSYTLDNIQLLTWEENNSKAKKDSSLLQEFAKHYSSDFTEAFDAYLRSYYDFV